MIRTASRCAVAVSLALAFVVLLPAAAQADLCQVEVDGKITWVDCDSTGGEDGGGGGGDAPPCDIEPGHDVCIDGVSCILHDPANLDEDVLSEELLPPRPGDDYHVAYRKCGDEPGTWYWTQPDEPSVEELALRAYGELPFPGFTPTFNPPERTLVNLETWWWADGADTDDLSASAGSVTVTVTAEPNRMEVDPGDGSDPVVCGVTTSRSDECVHTYRRASQGDGYTARIRLVWDVTFTDSEDPITLDGLPTDFVSPWQSTDAPVREVQSLVVPG